jgi:DNA polymerase III sliding clamp (beta) subunit (PCNA family)
VAIEFSVKKDYLQKWFASIAKTFVFSGQLHEMFKCLKFTVDVGGLSIEAFDNISYLRVADISIQVKNACEEDKASFLLDNELIQKIVASSSKENIEFKIIEELIEIKTESKYRIPQIDSSQYPSHAIPELDFGKIEEPEVIKILDTMLPFVAKDLIRPELSGVSISNHFYVSTEGTHGVIHPRVEKTLESMTMFPHFVKMVSSLKDIEDVQFGKDDKCIALRGKDFYYTCRLPETIFPYEAVNTVLEKKRDYENKVIVDSKMFFDALGRVTLLANDRFSQIRLGFEDDSLSIYCNAIKASSKSEEILCIDRDNFKAENTTMFVSIAAVDSLKSLFGSTGGELIFDFGKNTEPIFVKRKGSKYLFFAAPQRAIT